MSSYRCLFVLSVLLTVFVTSSSGDTYCEQDKIKACLKTSYNFLKANSRGAESFIKTSLEHYMDLLDGKEHMNVIHVSALNTITLPLEDIILSKNLHQQLCNKFNESMECIKPHEQYCDNEDRHDLEGIKEVFKEVCKPASKRVFNRFNPCVLMKNVTESSRQCERSLNTTAKAINPALECLNQDNITEACEEEVREYPATLLQHGAVIPIDADGAHVVIRSRICTAVQQTLQCYKDQVTEMCGLAAGEWEYTLRHTLVHLLLLDLDCLNEGYGGEFNTTCFPCDGNTCSVTRTQMCDGVADCKDGTDEHKKYCEKKGMSALTIILIVAVVLVIIAVAIGCVVKCVNESKYNQAFLSRSGSEEMTNIVTEEMSVGRSTPPPNTYHSNDNKNANYIYKPVST